MPSNSPASAPRRSPGNRPSDDALLDAACAIFHAVGFRAAVMESIAERANTTKPTLYAHFGSKDQLYRACLLREADKFRAALFATYDSASALDVAGEVRADMVVFYEYAAAHPTGFALLFDDAKSEPNTDIRGALVDSVTDRIADRIRAYSVDHRPTSGHSADLLGAMLVGIAVHGARQALRLRSDMTAAGELAAAMANAALRHLDPRVLAAVDAR
ncbi:TetR/AcrR family transcriptional regulator [Nocardia bovistercoris]|uniref:TetR/AcrR family transcriptional regulator n=1 Tax=Nocardia bovistercoris TaxID=2785916 RepID=A0A931IDS4_9NOCA|nr:TetR/AcrR family transcriptional regulator [Nocardia bovistercoris]MBH0777918.1 TetR/AcrR family transcriptional regulator [Nocardia bovistercoris]